VTISQCTRFMGSGGTGNCTSSKFKLSDITVKNITGTTKTTTVASFQCSAVEPCGDIEISGMGLKVANGTLAWKYLCGNVEDTVGFNCTGPACVGGSSTGGCV
jgi:hypothetical protein